MLLRYIDRLIDIDRHLDRIVDTYLHEYILYIVAYTHIYLHTIDVVDRWIYGRMDEWMDK